ncbi:alpha-hydroxy acid oxidase [Streptomyces sp. NL15-2K]|uniref:alpha-hydroxy acid oxidase n=1 Tax=Streptomyces sp. NL15-2K TaxID=376149 RepID=UPI000FF94FD5|nr:MULTISPECIES: alpha-hydroxy acid oxidase [Actinomycetes]WKX10501.1 alpha-hydroxy acid oxidase [Kutzneria buriramensis]GCB47965.1 L-lactate dehydrogenase [Streptomyces sp. NL15-2K]
MDSGEFQKLADAARKAVGAGPLDYCLGGAGDESTLRRNTGMLDRYAFVPRMLGAPVTPDLTVRVTGGTLSAPVLVSPMGLQSLYHPGGEVETARAAASLGLGHCLSTFSSMDAADVAAQAGDGLRWRQIYILRDHGLTHALVQEAEDHGYTALVCTVDVPTVGRRNRDRANGFDRFALAPPAIVKSPAFRKLSAEVPGSPQEVLDSVFPHPECTWDDVARLVSSTRLPVLVKGVLHPQDARLAVAAGASGVIVSNHGGRQLGRSISSIEALPGVRAELDDDIPVYVDSGIRGGEHAAVALALGARAVLVGRPVLLALAAEGHDGAVRVLREIVDELRLTMRLVGATTPDRLRQAALVSG